MEFIGAKYNNVFSLKGDILPKERVYEENLKVNIIGKSLLLVNNIGLEKYVAGVVQSEVFGSSTDVEFFKIQAIASRTYIQNLTQYYDLPNVHAVAYRLYPHKQ